MADYDNRRVQMFTSQGKFITAWGEFGMGTGQLNGPIAIAIDGNRHVYVAEWGNRRIQKFDVVQ